MDCLDIPAIRRRLPESPVASQDAPRREELHGMEVICVHGKKWLYSASQERLDLVKDSPALFECSCCDEETHAKWDVCENCATI